MSIWTGGAKCPIARSGNVFDTIYGLLTWFLVIFLGYGVRFLDLFGLGINKKWKPGQKLQVLLMAYSGARNTGAEVRVAEIIDQVNQVLGEENVDVNMMTLNLADAQEYFKSNRVNLKQMNYIFFWDVFKNITQNHVIVLVQGVVLEGKLRRGPALLFPLQHGPCRGPQKTQFQLRRRRGPDE